VYPKHLRGIMVRRIVVILFCALLTIATTAPARVIAETTEQCFSETGFCIDGRIREYWAAQGGLRVFGYPIGPQSTVQIEGKPVVAQAFERNRLELHPENARPYDVLLGRLGADRLGQQGRDWYGFPKSATADCKTFAQTQHAVCGRIWEVWRQYGLEFDGAAGISEAESLALFGLPLSGVQAERLSDGKEYQVQWFERARFELHPENAAPYDVLFGLLGNETRDHVPAAAPTDLPIVGAPSGTVAEAVRVLAPRAAANGYSYDDVVNIVEAYQRVGNSVGVDWFLAVAQMAHETGYLTSYWSARPQRNPAGLGVEGKSSATDPGQPGWVYNTQRKMWEKGLSFESWEDEAIPAHIGRMLAYALKDEQATPAQKTMIDYALLVRPLPAYLRGVAPTIVGLNGRWAFPGTTYGQRILEVMMKLRAVP
jgi:Mannosyl-glycoprotein endo-beta-N-acetylglucosaminidase